MNTVKSYIAGLMALVGFSAVMPSCQDHFDDPKLNDVPVATMTANTTIAQIKDLMWKDSNNYCDLIPERSDGSHYIISGRVISSDFAGNCFKYVIIQDAEGSCLNFSIDSYNLYLNYRRGQELVIDLTGLHAGKYRGLFQVGFPSFNSSIQGDETSFMAPQLFMSHTELNGMPDVAKLDTVTVNSFAELNTQPAELRKWQSRLVRFNNVEWVPNKTTPTLSTYHENVTQQLRDNDGNIIDVRTSGYANFWNTRMPEGRGDVVALLGYYISLADKGGWQLTLIDANSMLNWGNPTLPMGSKDRPYNVQQAVALQVNSPGATAKTWVKGYMVGTVAPEVTEVTSEADVEWTATPALNNTLVIGQTPDTKNLQECLVVALPQDSPLRTQANLRDNPGNYGKEILIQGVPAEFMGTYGLTGNSGSAAEFAIDGQTPDEPTKGDGTEANPYSCAQIRALNPQSTTDAVESGVWAKGYIVGYYEDYAAHFEAAKTQRANILLSDTPDASDAAQCICIQLVAQTDVRNALNLVDNPAMLGREVSVKGDVMKYNTLPGIKNTSEYKLDGDAPVKPDVEPVSSIDEKFATAIPSTWSQVQIAGNKTWYQREFDGTTYASMTGYNGTAPFDQWLVTPPVDMSKVAEKVLSFRTQVNGYGSTTSKFEVYVMTQADTKGTNTKLNPVIATAPESGYSSWAASGNLDLSAFSGIVYIGFRYAATQDANYATWCVTDVKLGSKGADTPDEPVTPPTPSDDYKGDFNSFNDGKPKATYGTYTNATGWTATNCNILSGSATSPGTNPSFSFIGSSESTLAPCLNGKVATPGELMSPTLTGGIKTLTFNYGFAYKETKCTFTVQVLQGANVVKEQKVELTTIEQYKAYEFSMDVNAAGDFTIRIVNDCASQSTSNKDRVAIWNLTWTN